MELNWSTVFFEIVNFLILVWILKHFFYRPVLDTIAARRAAIDRTVADAHAVRAEADELKGRYAARLVAWERDKEEDRKALRADLATEREHLLAALHADLEGEREKARVLEARYQEDCLRRYQETGLAQGARFVSQLLSGLAGPELEARLVDLALTQFDELPAERRDAIRRACAGAAGEARVVSAYPLDAARRERLAQRLTELLGISVACSFSEDTALLAGLRVTLGPWVFHANLLDELASFVASTHATG